MKNREPMEDTANCRQARRPRREGSETASEGEPQKPVDDNRAGGRFHFTHGWGLFLAESAGGKAARGTHANPSPARTNKRYGSRPESRRHKFANRSLKDWLGIGC
jgi:hypothetical protein